jgi:hypothetical protein
MAGRSEDVHVAAGDLHGEDVDPFQGDRPVDVEEVHGSRVVACTRRNGRHDVSVDRNGAGGVRRSLRIRRTV